MNMDLNMFDNKDLKKKRIFLLNIFNFKNYELPVKLLGQIHMGFALASRTQVPPLKQ
jgi:hypothetical protein